jgi:hypothetical protein
MLFFHFLLFFSLPYVTEKLKAATDEERESIFKEVFPEALSLMKDVFGNYVIQKFFDYRTPEQRKKIADQLVGHVLSLSIHMYGCRVVQKVIFFILFFFLFILLLGSLTLSLFLVGHRNC